MPPLVSVIIPSYNSGAFLQRAVDSALEQTHSNIEVVLVDDGSTDNTAEIARSYGDGVTYVYQRNRGLPAARNLGISVARGSLVAFLDADDWWEKSKLELQVAQVCQRTPLVHGRVIPVSESGAAHQDTPRRAEYVGNCYSRIFLANEILPSTVLVERAVVLNCGGFDETLTRGCEDLDLWLRIARQHQVAYVDRAVTWYRLHGNNMTTNGDRMLEARFEVCRRALQRDPGLRDLIGRRQVAEFMGGMALGVGYRLRKSHRVREARLVSAYALRECPGNVEAWFSLGLSLLPQSVVRRCSGLVRRMRSTALEQL